MGIKKNGLVLTREQYNKKIKSVLRHTIETSDDFKMKLEIKEAHRYIKFTVTSDLFMNHADGGLMKQYDSGSHIRGLAIIKNNEIMEFMLCEECGNYNFMFADKSDMIVLKELFKDVDLNSITESTEPPRKHN